MGSPTKNLVDRLPTDAWVLVDGTAVFSKANGNLAFVGSINQRASGTIVGSTAVWTGCSKTGVANPNLCDDWSTADAGTKGVQGRTDVSAAQMQWNAVSCDVRAPIYCIEVP